jgi:hypothetical protein
VAKRQAENAAGGSALAAHRGTRGLVLVVMCVGYFLVLLDVTIVNVALPSIGNGLGLSVAGLQGSSTAMHWPWRRCCWPAARSVIGADTSRSCSSASPSSASRRSDVHWLLTSLC